MHDRKDVEARAARCGREIFARLEGAAPVPLGPAWWDERMMGWTMGDEALKVQLFRFVDVLPMLHDDASVARHLREYFTQASDRLPGWMSFLARHVPERGPAGRLLALAARHSACRLARRFIAGSDVPEVLAAVARLRRRSLAFTVDLLGEATITEKEAAAYQGEYLGLVEGLSAAVNSWPEVAAIDRDDAGPLPRVNVSVKLSSLYSQFDPIDPEGTSRAVRERLRPILRLARRHGAFINIDMEQYAFKDVTIQIFEEVLDEPEFHDWPDVGLAVQAYLKDCPDDLRGLADWARRRGTPVWVRLVKGAYWDYENIVAAQQDWPVPVWEQKWQTDACYERMTEFLMENADVLRPALGSHNVRSLAHALAVADALGLPPRSFELQMLYGMADPIKEALTGMGRRVRVYTPYGQLLPGMAYLVRRLLENTANESFLRASFTEHVAVEQLLRNPLDVGRERGEPLPDTLLPAPR
jgi:RHH-type proline utilization regulon transcriptional repressor/proline dehydrogenase/delta 1-pyrroline-5-carboxylate dehydrogenase